MKLPCIGDIISNNLKIRDESEDYFKIPVNHYEDYVHPVLKRKLEELMDGIDENWEYIDISTYFIRGIFGIQPFDDGNVATSLFVLDSFLKVNGIDHDYKKSELEELLNRIYIVEMNRITSKFDMEDLEIICIGEPVPGWIFSTSIEWFKYSLKKRAFHNKDAVFEEIKNFIRKGIK